MHEFPEPIRPMNHFQEKKTLPAGDFAWSDL